MTIPLFIIQNITITYYEDLFACTKSIIDINECILIIMLLISHEYNNNVSCQYIFLFFWDVRS